MVRIYGVEGWGSSCGMNLGVVRIYGMEWWVPRV